MRDPDIVAPKDAELPPTRGPRRAPGSAVSLLALSWARPGSRISLLIAHARRAGLGTPRRADVVAHPLWVPFAFAILGPCRALWVGVDAALGAAAAAQQSRPQLAKKKRTKTRCKFTSTY